MRGQILWLQSRGKLESLALKERKKARICCAPVGKELAWVSARRPLHLPASKYVYVHVRNCLSGKGAVIYYDAESVF